MTGCKSKVRSEWFSNCGPRFLRPTIELIAPRIVVSLGERAYRAVTDAFGLERASFKDAVDLPTGYDLFGRTRLFPVYHCGARILNTHRYRAQQLEDWQKVKVALFGNR